MWTDLVGIGAGIFGVMMLTAGVLWSVSGSKASKTPPLDFKSDLKTVDGVEDLDAFLNRWRGKEIPRRKNLGFTADGEEVVFFRTLNPEEAIPWPSWIDYPCWLEFRSDTSSGWARQPAKLNLRIVNNANRHWDCRIVRRKATV